MKFLQFLKDHVLSASALQGISANDSRAIICDPLVRVLR